MARTQVKAVAQTELRRNIITVLQKIVPSLYFFQLNSRIDQDIHLKILDWLEEYRFRTDHLQAVHPDAGYTPFRGTCFEILGKLPDFR